MTADDGAVRGLGDLVPLVRPDLDTVAGLRRWAATRGQAERPPILSVAEHRALPPRERRVYDLRRRVSNANLGILDTSMLVAARDAMEQRIWANALSNEPGAVEGIMVNGGGAQGKTATVLAVVADFLDDWEEAHGLRNPTAYPGGRDAHEPVVYARVPAKPTPKTLCGAVLDAVGEDWQPGEGLGGLRRRASRSIKELGTRVLVLDDITRIKMHRLDDQDVLDLIRDLMDTGATLVLVGVGITSSGLLSEGTTDASRRPGQQTAPDGAPTVTLAPSRGGRLRKRSVEDDEQYTQTERRFKLLHVTNFGFRTNAQKREWVSFLAGMGAELRLLGMDKDDPGRVLTDGDLPEYLFRRTGGVVGTVNRLVTEAALAAVDSPDPETGEERITVELLDGITANYSAEKAASPRRARSPTSPPSRPLPPARPAGEGPAPSCRSAGQRLGQPLRARDHRGARRAAQAAGPEPGPAAGGEPGRVPAAAVRPAGPDPERDDRAGRAARRGRQGPRRSRARAARGRPRGVRRGVLAHRGRGPRAHVAEPRRDAARPAGPAPQRQRAAGRHRRVDQPRRTRYCPQCLAGDEVVPGYWRASWQLPWHYACLRHQRLLSDACPACRAPVGKPTPIGAFGALVPNPGVPDLAFDRCRHRPGASQWLCGHPLPDAAPACGEDAQAPAWALSAQARLDELIGLDRPAADEPALAGEPLPLPLYAAALQGVAVLVRASGGLPRAPRAAPGAWPVLAALTDPATTPTELRRLLHPSTPPETAAAAAALFAPAVGILDAPSHDELDDRLAAYRDPVREHRPDVWKSWLRQYPDQNVKRLLKRHRRWTTLAAAARTAQPASLGGLRGRHLPQQLPEPHAGLLAPYRHLAVTDTGLHRATCVLLWQRVEGAARRADAAAALGYPDPGTVDSAVSRLQRLLNEQRLADAYARTLAELHAALAAGPLVDYAARRAALAQRPSRTTTGPRSRPGSCRCRSATAASRTGTCAAWSSARSSGRTSRAATRSCRRLVPPDNKSRVRLRFVSQQLRDNISTGKVAFGPVIDAYRERIRVQADSAGG